MVVTLSDDEVSDHESSSDEDGNFITFTTTVVVNESVIVEENLLMGNSLNMLICKKLLIHLQVGIRYWNFFTCNRLL